MRLDKNDKTNHYFSKLIVNMKNNGAEFTPEVRHSGGQLVTLCSKARGGFRKGDGERGGMRWGYL
jgi:hypothetical protein